LWALHTRLLENCYPKSVPSMFTVLISVVLLIVQTGVFWCITWLVLDQAHEQAIVNVVWLPPEYGDAIACVCADGTLSLWEEVAAGQLFLCLLGLVYDVLYLQLSCTFISHAFASFYVLEY
jgi:hypothetical protein